MSCRSSFSFMITASRVGGARWGRGAGRGILARPLLPSKQYGMIDVTESGQARGLGSANSDAAESILRISGGILGGRPEVQGLDVITSPGNALQKANAMPFTRPRHWLRWLIG